MNVFAAVMVLLYINNVGTNTILRVFTNINEYNNNQDILRKLHKLRNAYTLPFMDPQTTHEGYFGLKTAKGLLLRQNTARDWFDSDHFDYSHPCITASLCPRTVNDDLLNPATSSSLIIHNLNHNTEADNAKSDKINSNYLRKSKLKINATVTQNTSKFCSNACVLAVKHACHNQKCKDKLKNTLAAYCKPKCLLLFNYFQTKITEQNKGN